MTKKKTPSKKLTVKKEIVERLMIDTEVRAGRMMDSAHMSNCYKCCEATKTQVCADSTPTCCPTA